MKMRNEHPPAADPRPLVVHVVHRFAVGGLENGVVNLVNRMSARRFRHAIVALTDVTDFSDRIVREDVQCHALHKPAGHAVRLYPQLARLFRRLQPTIVHTRNLAALEAMVPAALAGVPLRVHGEHGRDVEDLDGSSARYRWVRRVFSPFVQRYVALSQDLERYLVEGVGLAPWRVAQIYNGVDTARFSPAPEGRAPVEGSPFNDPTLWVAGTVGRMHAVKDQRTLAQAFVDMLRSVPGARERARLMLIGDGPQRAEVEQVLREGDALSCAWFAGERDDVPDLLRGMDCFVLPSLAEGVSNTMLEAMACGLPVIATRVGGNVELVRDQYTGVLVPPGDAAALALALNGYYALPQLAREHGRDGRARVERQFSLDYMVQRYESLYLSLLGRRDAPRVGLKAT